MSDRLIITALAIAAVGLIVAFAVAVKDEPPCIREHCNTVVSVILDGHGNVLPIAQAICSCIEYAPTDAGANP